MSEKKYTRSIEQGVSFLKKTMGSKTPKKTLSFGRKAEAHFKKAISEGEQMRLKKIPYIYEYLQQIQAQIGASLLELNKPKDAILVFENALISNRKSPQNIKQKEIKSLILAELAKIHGNHLGNINKAENYANQALQIGSEKNYNQEDLLDLYLALHSIYVRKGNLKKIGKNLRSMVKLAKRDKRKDLKAQVYFSYGRFLFGVHKNEVESRKYFRKAQTLFKTIGFQDGYDEVAKFIDENQKLSSENAHKSEDINTT